MPRRIFLYDKYIIPAIWLNSIVIFLMAFQGFCDNLALEIIDHAFTLFFITELILKIRFFGWKQFSRSRLNLFDFTIVILSAPSLLIIFFPIPNFSFLLVFRIIRSLKLLLFVRMIPNLSNIVLGTRRAIRASFFVMAGLGIYCFILATLCTHLFRDKLPEHFGDPMTSFYSMFRLITLEGWHEIPDALAIAFPGNAIVWKFFFSLIVLTGGMLGFSIVNAIFVDSFMSDQTADLEKQVRELHKKIDKLLEEKNKEESGTANAPNDKE